MDAENDWSVDYHCKRSSRKSHGIKSGASGNGGNDAVKGVIDCASPRAAPAALGTGAGGAPAPVRTSDPENALGDSGGSDGGGRGTTARGFGFRIHES